MTIAHAVRDSRTMLRRNLLHALRYPSMTLSVVGMPIVMLLLFVYVLGGVLGAGLGTSGSYVDYLAPGIILMAAASGSMTVAISVCSDMTEGIINRFRTMPISRASVLTGHVVGGTVQTVLSVVLITAVALLVGFRPTGAPLDWLAALGLVTLVSFALSWISAAAGLMTRSVETASNIVLPLSLLPFIGSAFVPTDSMPPAVRWFAENQPFTPIIETIRGLLMGTPVGANGMLAVGWCAVIALVGYLWARAAFNRAPA
ncbi:ABC-2 type transport system permease protein [Saccharopolyspora antimicrobica]|uniref:Transport permease protein n=1 Tax=Saccharopolyspora antimicrobica TaxID=455193 RepID=A0A1I5HV51_9PSEU|nr:ABC transporter permease [Saccharopolyspora antimicrobica]RKT82299.1 ABC-2 type transport system permease protein [Saccharopolyspora antimicrobica]SFO52204.1 ABC-2 type transport system permease protein [Saccharopolyspora antimicrobica]